MDSKLVVEQMSGRWKVKHADMIPLQRQRGRHSPGNSIGDVHLDSARRRTRTPTGSPTRPWTPPPAIADRRTGTGCRRRRRRLGPRPPALRAGWTRRAPRPGCCCSGTGRPRCRSTGATPVAGTRPSPRSAGPRRRRGCDASRATAKSPPSCPPRWGAPARPRGGGAVLGLPVTVHEGLTETDFGEWEGLTFRRGRRARSGTAPRVAVGPVGAPARRGRASTRCGSAS